jgi:chromosomal replication initiator protein
LLNAIANEYSLKNKTRNILLINAVELGQKIFNNFKNTAQIQKIKNEIISHELILIDDVQYFIKRPSILEILNEIVSLVKTKNKIIIFASSLTSNKYKIANRTFSALLSSGMDCMLSHTHLIDKKKIIINEINRQNLNFELTNDALEYLASRNVDGNLNKLITLIDKIGIYVLQDGIKILTKSDIEKITNTLKYETHSYIAAIEIICKYFDIDSDVIFSPSRIKNIVNVRNICMYFLYKKFNLSLKKIGNLFGNRSHSTIKHGIEKINLIITNKTKQLSQLNDIEKLL